MALEHASSPHRRGRSPHARALRALSAEIFRVSEPQAPAVPAGCGRLGSRSPTSTLEPELRRLGVARALLDAAVRWAAGANARSVALLVTCSQTAAERLYERAGFEPDGAPEPLRPGSSLLVQPMRLDL
jgi:GNAT superfamily N-acetyltransferase